MSEQMQNGTVTTTADDGNDVYYCFGGSTLSAMLHLRYNATRKQLSNSVILLRKYIFFVV